MLCQKLYLVENFIITVSQYILQCRDVHLYCCQLRSGYMNTWNCCSGFHNVLVFGISVVVWNKVAGVGSNMLRLCYGHTTQCLVKISCMCLQGSLTCGTICISASLPFRYSCVQALWRNLGSTVDYFSK